MKQTFQITFTYKAILDDWLVIFYNEKNEQVYVINTESWQEWGDVGIEPFDTLSSTYIQLREAEVLAHAVELYKNSFEG